MLFARLLGWAATVLGVALPELHVRTDLKEGLVDVVHGGPLLLAGQAVLIASTTEQPFHCARHLARHRPELFLRVLYPSLSELTVLLLAGIKIAQPAWSPPEHKETVENVARLLSVELLQPQRERLQHAVRTFFDEGAKASLKPWWQGVETTAARAGLLLCADLEVAQRALRDQGPVPGGPTPDERFRELLVYAVSKRYSDARRALGISLS